MSEIVRSRTIRPSSRHRSSNNYRVDTSKVRKGDTLLVNVYHESVPFLKSYRFSWKQVIGKNITFSTKGKEEQTTIKWNGISPVELKIEPKIILCRIAWMKYYNGRANIDIPKSGAKYILKNKKGGEIYNFKNRNGKVYGYFPFINKPSIQNLGADRKAEMIPGITVVFCSKHPREGKIRIVGWYKKATVYSKPTSTPDSQSFHAIAKYQDSKLIPENDRIFLLPDVFGRSSLFYFSKHSEKKALLNQVMQYIQRGGKVEAYNQIKGIHPRKGGGYQKDLVMKLQVERKAIEVAFKYYGERYGYNNVITVEKDNKGWDLEVRSKIANINVEVKGNSGAELYVQLTPNEYSFFSKKPNNYQLFVVNNALQRKPLYRVFEYQPIVKRWVADDNSVLKIGIVKSARITL